MNRVRGYLLVLASTLVISTTGILMKYILTHFPIRELTLAFWRALIVSCTMLFALKLARPQWLRVQGRDIPFYLAYGFLGVAFSQALWIYSVSLNGAALGTVLGYVAPAFVTLLSRWLFGEPITPAKRVALALTFAGVVLVSRVYDTAHLRLALPGLLCGVAAGLAYGSYTLFGKEASRRHHPWVAMAYAFAFGTFFLALAQQPEQLFALGRDARGWTLVGLLALVPTMGGYGLFTLSLRDLPAGVAGLIQPLEVVFASVIAFFALGETLQPVQVAGAALILTGVLFLRPRRAGAEDRA